MLDIDKIYNSRTAVTYYDSGTLTDLYLEYMNENYINEECWKEYTDCHSDKKYFKNSNFYKYLINKRRTEIINMML